MKVLKHGRPRPEWPFDMTLECRHCGCKFHLEQGDQYEIDTTDWREPRCVKVACPDCGEAVWQS